MQNHIMNPLILLSDCRAPSCKIGRTEPNVIEDMDMINWLKNNCLVSLSKITENWRQIQPVWWLRAKPVQFQTLFSLEFTINSTISIRQSKEGLNIPKTAQPEGENWEHGSGQGLITRNNYFTSKGKAFIASFEINRLKWKLIPEPKNAISFKKIQASLNHQIS